MSTSLCTDWTEVGNSPGSCSDWSILPGLSTTCLNWLIDGEPMSCSSTVTDVTGVLAYTVQQADCVLLVDSSLGDVAITLEDATDMANRTVTIKKTSSDANTITMTPIGSQKIDGQDTKILVFQYEFVEIITDGTNWFIIGE